MKREKVSAIICAAGAGVRAGFNKNKLLAPLYGAPALYHTLKAFDLEEIDEVVVAASEKDFEEVAALAAGFGYKTVVGGATRTESVKRALDAVTGEIVLIHDGARPFVTERLILSCIESVKKFGSGVCAVKACDAAVYASYGEICDRLDRDSLYLVQTPQGFFTDDIKNAYAAAGDKVYTDDSAVYGEYIQAPRLVDGDAANIKLTYKSDFARGMPPAAVRGGLAGFGVDTHAFGEGKYVTLAGVKIDCDKRLIAHSDGDVVIHALMDALLSAAGLDDIGRRFPDTDEKYKGADSAILLREVVSALGGMGLAVNNVSVSVQAEKPRLSPHTEKMKSNLSEICRLPAERIAVAAGTCEGLGFVGEGLGITAYCAVTLKEVKNG